MNDWRVIVALDMHNRGFEHELVWKLREVAGFKIHLPFPTRTKGETAEHLKKYGGYRAHGATFVMDDDKHFEDPVVARWMIDDALRHGINLVTVHASGGPTMLQKLIGPRRELVNDLVAVLVPTFLPEEDTRLIYGVKDRLQAVVRLATFAIEAGYRKVVCAASDIEHVQRLFPNLTIQYYVPGIRRTGALNAGETQVFYATPREAIRAGATYLIVGRPITRADNPAEELRLTNEEVTSALRERGY